MNITEFFAARLDEEEAAAHADGRSIVAGLLFDYIAGAHWESVDEGIDICAEAAECLLTDLPGRMALDPVRALADVAAKRKILELHQQWPVLITKPAMVERSATDIDQMRFRMTRSINWATTQEYIARFGTEPPTSAMILALIQPYADHPDFDPTWRSE